ncbi:ABC-type multidrug transport system fused ATPase/permease subunit [Paenibacillus sp. DS2015]|uniref:ABC transporter ATP-binding protein n=1 Tax=Paenibacillus sp. DS2015 TaxID=3373917 RepID=UPI003D1FEBFD
MDQRKTFQRLVYYMKRQRLLYAGLTLTMFVGVTLNLSVAWFLSVVTNAAAAGETERWTFFIGIGASIILLLTVNTYFDHYWKTRVSVKVRKDMRMDTMEQLLKVTVPYRDDNHSGELLSRLTTDNQAVGDGCGHTLMNLIKNPILILTSFVYLMYINWQLALICLAIGPLTLLLGGIFGKMMRNNTGKLQGTLGQVAAFLQDVLGGTSVVKTFGLEKKLFSKFNRYNRTLVELETNSGKIEGTATASSALLGNLTFFIAILVAAFSVANGSLQVGAMLAFIQLMNYLVGPFMELPGQWATFQGSLGSADRIFTLMDAPKEMEVLPESSKSHEKFGVLSLKEATFQYSVTGNKVLNEVSFEAKSGEVVAIVGSSGGGKSTLFKMLLGFYPLTTGKIVIDGKNTDDMALRELRDYFAYVPQENHLFTGTIRDNIADGKQDASEEEIISAAKSANAYNFIVDMENGLDSEIGERGTLLSGGQRQRISIARAILRDAPVLLLDEATAALDNESERLVQDALSHLVTGRTTLVIAHRLSTITHADLILVMEDGSIVEKGNHATLMDRRERYYQLYTTQLQRQEEEELEHEAEEVAVG